MKSSNRLIQRTATALLGLLLVLPAPLSLALTNLLEEDFDSENSGFPGAVNYNEFAQFEVTAGSVDLIGNGFQDFFPDNGLYVDLDGTTVTGGTLRSKTTFSLEPGLVYQLVFDLGNTDQQFGGGSTDNSATVSLGAAYSETFDRSGLTPFETITRDVIVESTTLAALEFQQAGGDNLGILIDNVSLFFEEFVSGDLNMDGFVDGLDLGILLASFGTSTTADMGELNGSAPVDGLDLGILLSQWNALPLSPVTAVPEPSSLLLAALASVGMLLRRRPSS